VISTLGFLPNIGPIELLVVLAIVILIVGPKRIPEAARSIGRGLRGFRDEVGGKDEDESEPPKLADRTGTETTETTETKN
jgi:sec-independent protein translocase protein TatA